MKFASFFYNKLEGESYKLLPSLHSVIVKNRGGKEMIEEE
jgi:hypothetical protein